jgi:hypothetical protein
MMMNITHTLTWQKKYGISWMRVPSGLLFMIGTVVLGAYRQALGHFCAEVCQVV